MVFVYHLTAFRPCQWLFCIQKSRPFFQSSNSNFSQTLTTKIRLFYNLSEDQIFQVQIIDFLKYSNFLLLFKVTP